MEERELRWVGKLNNMDRVKEPVVFPKEDNRPPTLGGGRVRNKDFRLGVRKMLFPGPIRENSVRGRG